MTLSEALKAAARSVARGMAADNQRLALELSGHRTALRTAMEAEALS